MSRRILAEDIHVPSFAHDVPGGYPVQVQTNPGLGWDMVVHVFGPHMSSPRPRVTSRGTFMPSDYRKHCERLGASLAYARGLVEADGLRWRADAPMRLDLAFWGEKQIGDLDNLAKTVMDAGQLHRGEKPGAELWANDRQIRSLSVDWIDVEDDAAWCQLVVRVRMLSTHEANSPAPRRKRVPRMVLDEATGEFVPIPRARMARKRVVETQTGDDPPKRQKAQEGATEAQQRTRKGKA